MWKLVVPRLGLVLPWLGCGPLGCADPASAARTVLVRVTNDEGQPLASAPVEIDALSAIKTARDGTARISLAAQGAPRARIAVTCPQGSRELPPRHVPRSTEGGGARLELSFVCRPVARNVVVVVRAPGGEGLWLRADGEPLGQVADDGTLHAVLSRAPDTDLHLLLDTAERAVSPRNPALELRIADRDELVLFDQPLALAKSTRGVTKRSAVVRAPVVAPLPYAIRGAPP